MLLKVLMLTTLTVSCQCDISTLTLKFDTSKSKMQVLELYSGIGGMHMALEASGVKFQILASIDINPVANTVYKHNFASTTHLNRNIEGLSAKFVNNLEVDSILMSPPCQPFTRNGLKNDVRDPRTDSFKHILEILPHCTNIQKILIENVKGFEASAMRGLLVSTLEKSAFVYQEFILSPSQFGVANTRHRYYCIAKKKPLEFSFETGELKYNFPVGPSTVSQKIFKIGDICDLEANITDFYLSNKILTKHAGVLDICYADSENSCCFTKAYARYIEGTGSVFTDKSRDFVESVFEKIDNEGCDEEDCLKLLRTLNLRFFTPKEVSRLMSFPESFSFPLEVSSRQKYNLLGNSVNVKVVSELIKLLL